MIKPLFTFIILGCFCINPSYANPFQPDKPLGLEVNSLQRGSSHVTLSGGLSLPFTDVDNMALKPAFELLGGYCFTHGLSIQASLVKGWMSAGEQNDESRYFTNNYWSENLIVRFNPMAIWHTQTNLKANFYIGAGLSLVQSYTLGQYRFGKADGYKVNYAGNDFFLPAELGVNIPIAQVNKLSDRPDGQFLILNINYRNYFSFIDNMDSYIPPAKYNKHNDGFSIFSVGLSYVF